MGKEKQRVTCVEHQERHRGGTREAFRRTTDWHLHQHTPAPVLLHTAKNQKQKTLSRSRMQGGRQMAKKEKATRDTEPWSQRIGVNLGRRWLRTTSA
jgi:hypothetical protein